MILTFHFFREIAPRIMPIGGAKGMKNKPTKIMDIIGIIGVVFFMF
jgi:hypothetical protein